MVQNQSDAKSVVHIETVDTPENVDEREIEFFICVLTRQTIVMNKAVVNDSVDSVLETPSFSPSGTQKKQ